MKNLGKSASTEYLADIAALEWAHHRALHAPEEAPANLRPLVLPSAARRRALRVLLHPSVSLVASRFPIVTIWEANRSGGEAPIISRWRREAALVARALLGVDVPLLPPAGHAFLDALRGGRTIAGALVAGRSAAPDFDIGSDLALLAESNIVIGVY